MPPASPHKCRGGCLYLLMLYLSESQINHLKQQALCKAQLHEVAMLLDNNFSTNAWGLNRMEFMAAFGAKHLLVAPANGFAQLEDFIRQHTGEHIMVQLAYDLKNELEQLHSSHPDHIGFPLLVAFVPEELLVINPEQVCTHGETLAAALLQQHHTIPHEPFDKPVMQARVSREQYLRDVERLREHIIEGDVYEINYCTEYYAEGVQVNPYHLYERLKQKSPVPFGAFYKWEGRYLLCASPERFMCNREKRVYSQPIKGTTRRGKDAATDERYRNALLNSEKERAENLMIVDLVRNDLARTSLTGTVKVDELFGIYAFPQVHQMISTVSAEPAPEYTLTQVVSHAFPMGSMTGAPKIMAMQLIEQYEQTRRGLYSGSVGYISADGHFDLNVVIRSLQYNTHNGYLSFETGGAITYDSVAADEYEECRLKASAMEAVLL